MRPILAEHRATLEPHLRSESAADDVIFTVVGFKAGARAALPVAGGSVAYGVAFGALAGGVGMSLAEASLMSGLVGAGAAQFVVLQSWAAPPPLVAILLSTFVVNARLLLMGATLRPWFARLSPAKTFASMFVLSDESWALTLRAFAAGKPDDAFLLGSGVVLNGAWLAATIAGRAAGAGIADPARWGLDFAFVAVFAALLVGMWKGAPTLVPWTVAAIVAVATAHLLPTPWHVLLGGLAGSAAGAWRDGR